MKFDYKKHDLKSKIYNLCSNNCQKQNKNKTELRHIQNDRTFNCTNQRTNNVMVSLKNGLTV